MGKVRLDISMSLDGFVAGPDPSMEDPLGKHGLDLHQWVFGLKTWRAAHGGEGGESGADDDIVAESIASTGAVIMGRKMFSGGEGPWGLDPNAEGWWGDEPPFGTSVFILTHYSREREPKAGGTVFTFVNDGIESALSQAREAAGDKDVLIAGGADVAQQYLRAGLLDELQIHVAPVLLGSGTRLFEGMSPETAGLVPERVVAATPSVTHLRYTVKR
ncbi:MAG TPA: dihydrofolate reductase family protein [Gaiellales bacterium]